MLALMRCFPRRSSDSAEAAAGGGGNRGVTRPWRGRQLAWARSAWCSVMNQSASSSCTWIAQRLSCTMPRPRNSVSTRVTVSRYVPASSATSWWLSPAAVGPRGGAEHRRGDSLLHRAERELLEALASAAQPARRGCEQLERVTDTAGALLVSAGEIPERLRSEAAFAHLCGVAPIDASSGLTSRKRLNRGGDRSANHALWRIVMVRMVFDPRTRAYVARRTHEGRSKREIIRSLKRYVARELYRCLPRPQPA